MADKKNYLLCNNEYEARMFAIWTIMRCQKKKVNLFYENARFKIRNVGTKDV